MELKGFIEKAWDEVEGEPLKTKINDDGSGGKAYGKILIQGKTLSIFNGKAFSALKALRDQGMGVVIEVEEKGEYTNYKSHRGDSGMSEATESKSERPNGDSGIDPYRAAENIRVAVRDIGLKCIENYKDRYAATEWVMWYREMLHENYKAYLDLTPDQPTPATELPQREEPKAEGAPICYDSNGDPVSRAMAIGRLQRYIKNQPDSGPRFKALEGVGEHEKLNDYSDEEIVIMYTAMRTEQETI